MPATDAPSKRTRTFAGLAVVAVSLTLAAILAGIGFARSSTISIAQYQYGKKTICHKPASKKGGVTISISENAWPAHKRHGDTEGPCPNAKKKKHGDEGKSGSGEKRKSDDHGKSEDKKSDDKGQSGKKDKPESTSGSDDKAGSDDDAKSDDKGKSGDKGKSDDKHKSDDASKGNKEKDKKGK